jgi:hypothetical protein
MSLGQLDSLSIMSMFTCTRNKTTIDEGLMQESDSLNWFWPVAIWSLTLLCRITPWRILVYHFLHQSADHHLFAYRLPSIGLLLSAAYSVSFPARGLLDSTMPLHLISWHVPKKVSTHAPQFQSKYLCSEINSNLVSSSKSPKDPHPKSSRGQPINITNSGQLPPNMSSLSR